MNREALLNSFLGDLSLSEFTGSLGAAFGCPVLVCDLSFHVVAAFLADAESGICSLENASVDGEVLVVDNATIDENGVLDFGYQETGNTETTTTEVSDDGTAIVSDSAVDETTGTLSLNNASVSEDGTLTI